MQYRAQKHFNKEFFIMSNDGDFTMELFGIPDASGDEVEESTEITAEDISEEELEQRLQTATEEEINSYNDDGVIPPLRTPDGKDLPAQPKQVVVADGAFQLPGGKKLRAELEKMGLTEVDAVGEIQSNQIETTEGYVAIREWQRWAMGHGFTISFLQKLVGGNRALTPPLHPMFRTLWHGKRKYFKAEVMSESALEIMRKIREEQWLAQKDAQKEPKPKKERKAKADAIPQEVATTNDTVADLSKATLVTWLNNAVPNAKVNAKMSKAQLLTIVEANGLTLKDYLAQS